MDSAIVKRNYIYFILKARFTLKRKTNDKQVLRAIISFSIFSFLATITQTLNLSADKILLGFIAPLSVTIYTLSVAFNGYVATCYSSVSAVFAIPVTSAVCSATDFLTKFAHFLDNDFTLSIKHVGIVFSPVKISGQNLLTSSVLQASDNVVGSASFWPKPKKSNQPAFADVATKTADNTMTIFFSIFSPFGYVHRNNRKKLPYSQLFLLLTFQPRMLH